MSTPDPFYYLNNFEEALACVVARSGDLLSEAERGFAREFGNLSKHSRALLVRLVMRQGDLFRRSAIDYPEIENIEVAIEPLTRLGWIDPAPMLTLSELFRITTRTELAARFTELRSRSTTKADIFDALLPHHSLAVTFHEWLGSSEVVYRVRIAPMVSCFRWLFFGSDRAWSEFVLVDLGIFEYEAVPFDDGSRPFNSRSDIEFFFSLRRCEDALHQGLEPEEALKQVPDVSTTVSWLQLRRGVLRFQIGQIAERSEEWELALRAYAQSDTSEARVRHVRLLERLQRLAEAEQVVKASLDRATQEAELQQLRRVESRLRRHRGLPAPAIQRAKMVFTDWELQFESGVRVEQRLVDHLNTEESPVAFVENSLICSLFGLLCWPAIFAPIRGAFFHRFQSGPVDLWATDFVQRRIELFENCLRELECPDYRSTILGRFASKFGVRSPFVHWQALTPALLEHALEFIPASHLRLFFNRMLLNLGENATGLSDLIQFNWGDAGYRMIEVKGPGDQLQDHQRRWFEYGRQHGLPLEVHRVRWSCASDVSAAG